MTTCTLDANWCGATEPRPYSKPLPRTFVHKHSKTPRTLLLGCMNLPRQTAKSGPTGSVPVR